MRGFLVPPVLAVAAMLVGCASAVPPGESALPLRKVRLYETGVGYFEREGPLGGDSSLPVPSGHLDDAIKTLVVLRGDATLEDVSFESRVSPAVARARAGLPVEGDGTVGFAVLLESLRGERVEAADDRQTVRGRLLDVVEEPLLDRIDERESEARQDAEREASPLGDDAPTNDPGDEPKKLAVLLTDDGAFVRLEVARLRALQPLDPELRRRFETALDARADLRSSAERRLFLRGTSDAPVRVGYLAESPVWRTTYRLVFAGDAPTLQAWALVHNDTDEHWRGVDLELTSGRPDSFLFPLAAPRYERRTLEHPERELSSVPQLLGQSADALWGDFAGDSIGLGGIGVTGTGYGGGGTGAGYGSGHGRIGGRAQVGSSDLLRVGDLAATAEANAEETETSFVYRATRPVDLGPHRSALVPFLQTPVGGKNITLFDDFKGAAHHAIAFENSTGRTLPAGPVSVFAAGGFAGEALLSRLVQGERQLLVIGEDLDTELEVIDQESADQPKRVLAKGDVLVEHFLRTRTVRIELDNRSGRARSVYVAVSAGANAKIDGADRVDFDRLTGRPLAILAVDPAARDLERTVVVVEGLSRSTQVDQLVASEIEELAGADLPQDDKNALRALAVAQKSLEEAEVRLAAATKAVERIEEDLTRLRAHLQALAEPQGPGDNPLVTRLLATEDKLEAARVEVERETTAVERLRGVVVQALEPLREG